MESHYGLKSDRIKSNQKDYTPNLIFNTLDMKESRNILGPINNFTPGHSFSSLIVNKRYDNP